MRRCKIAYFSLLSPYNEKWPKNVIFHEFFKLLLGDLRWCFRYVEMFWGPLEGVLNHEYILVPFMTHNRKYDFHPRNAVLPQHWSKAAFSSENYIFYCESYTGLKCILGLKKPSRGPKNISTYLKQHVRSRRSSLKKHEKSHFLVIFHYKSLKG